ncbi:hypothetical protein PUN28_019230 [Cardiocondyla obscurior]|uniref:Uncharacterized protein n=1 Tax=Cardiocondyla obscurior TaxID=286306 RepID=A0AAW2EEA0_9HYME
MRARTRFISPDHNTRQRHAIYNSFVSHMHECARLCPDFPFHVHQMDIKRGTGDAQIHSPSAIAGIFASYAFNKVTNLLDTLCRYRCCSTNAALLLNERFREWSAVS